MPVFTTDSDEEIETDASLIGDVVEEAQSKTRYAHDLEATADDTIRCADCGEEYRPELTDESPAVEVAEHFDGRICPGDHRWKIGGAYGDKGYHFHQVAVQCTECGEIRLWRGKHAAQYSGWDSQTD